MARSKPAPNVQPETAPSNGSDPLSFPVSRDLGSMKVTARDNIAELDEVSEPAADNGTSNPSRPRRRDLAAKNDGPDSRPSKRREVVDEEEGEEEQGKFSWNFKFEEGEEQPEELQATSPLLSRAFRSSVG